MNSTEERTRVVKAASKIILTDIRSKVYDIENYPAADNFLGGVDSDIPETLKLLLNEIILKGKKGNTDGWDKKITALSHCIISAARPKSFLSPLQIGVSSFLYKKFPSRGLIRVISSLGFCASYNIRPNFLKHQP